MAQVCVGSTRTRRRKGNGRGGKRQRKKESREHTWLDSCAAADGGAVVPPSSRRAIPVLPFLLAIASAVSPPPVWMDRSAASAPSRPSRYLRVQERVTCFGWGIRRGLVSPSYSQYPT